MTEIEELVAPKQEQSPEHVIKKMHMHLDVRLAQLKEDHKKMQIATVAVSTSSQDATQAFKALRAGDGPTVMSLVLSDPALLQAIDSVSATCRRNKPCYTGRANEGWRRWQCFWWRKGRIC